MLVNNPYEVPPSAEEGKENMLIIKSHEYSTSEQVSLKQGQMTATVGQNSASFGFAERAASLEQTDESKRSTRQELLKDPAQ